MKNINIKAISLISVFAVIALALPLMSFANTAEVNTTDSVASIPTGGVGTTDTTVVIPTGGAGTTDTTSNVPTGNAGTTDNNSNVPAGGAGTTDGNIFIPVGTISNADASGNNNNSGANTGTGTGGLGAGTDLTLLFTLGTGTSTSTATTTENLATSTPSASLNCPLINSFMKMGWNNNPAEVKKLQNFLNQNENANISVNGIYDQATYDAVLKFQEKYLSDVLSPWNARFGSGMVYLTTKNKINNVACNTNNKVTVTLPTMEIKAENTEVITPEATTTGEIIPETVTPEENAPVSNSNVVNQNRSNLAAAVSAVTGSIKSLFVKIIDLFR